MERGIVPSLPPTSGSGPGYPLREALALIARGGETAFRPGDRVRWSGGKTGTVLSEPRQCDYARGDPFTGVGVEVMPDKSIYGAGATLVYLATLTRLDGPEAVVVVDLDDEETLKEIVRADRSRGVETVDHAALRLEKQIVNIVRRAAELNPALPRLGSRITVGQAMEVLEAAGQLPGIPQVVLEKVWGMEVNLLVIATEKSD